MESAFLTCPICYEDFNSAKKLARIIPTCGHTVCSTCLTSLLQNPTRSQRKCPLDQQAFPSELNTIDSFKLNYALNQIVELKASKELCPEHQEEMPFACLTDQRKICNTCVAEGGHQNHKIKTLKSIKLETQSHLNKIKDIKKTLSACHSEAIQTSREIKTILLKRIRGEFDDIRKVLAEKEQEIIFQVNSSFHEEETRIESLIGTTSDTTKSLDTQATDLDNIFVNQEFLKNEHFFRNVQDYLVNYKVELDSQAIDKEREIVKGKLEELFQSFKRFTNNQTQAWSKLKFLFEENLLKGICRGVLKDLPVMIVDNENNERMETEEVSSVFKISTHFEFKLSEQKLIISTKNQQKDALIEMEKWKGTKNVTIKIAHDISDKEDIEVFNFIWRRLKGTGTLCLEISAGGLSSKLIQLFTETQLAFSKVEINLEKQNLDGKNDIALLFSRLLCCKLDLKRLDVNLNGSTLTRQILQLLLEDRLSDAPRMEEVTLMLDNASISDGDIYDLAFYLPQVKEFHLSLQGIKLGSKTVEWISKTCLEPMQPLENLALSLYKAQINGSDLSPLFSGLERFKLKNLLLDVSSTKLSGSNIRVLGRAMSSFQDTLEVLQLGLCEINISDEVLDTVFIELPKLSHLDLALANTQITDESLQKLANKTLLSAKALIDFRLFVNSTKIRDIGIASVLRNLNNGLKTLKIDMQSTKASDESVETFVTSKVPSLKNLTSFKLNVSNTKISEYLRSQIKELEKSINVQKNAT